MDGVTAQSWHTTRAAVLYQLADECRRWRGVTDRTLDLAEAVDAAKGRGMPCSLIARSWQ